MPAALDLASWADRLALGDAPGTLDFNKLFIEPRQIRGGVGRALLAHRSRRGAAARRGAKRLTILADPNTVGFYERTLRGAKSGRRPRTPVACCRSTRSGPIPPRERRDLGSKNGSQCRIP
jgi:hypothetical protein